MPHALSACNPIEDTLVATPASCDLCLALTLVYSCVMYVTVSSHAVDTPPQAIGMGK